MSKRSLSSLLSETLALASAIVVRSPSASRRPNITIPQSVLPSRARPEQCYRYGRPLTASPG